MGNRLTWADLAMFCLVDPEKKNNTEVLQQYSTFKTFHTVKENQFLTQLWSISPQLMMTRPCLDNLVVRVAEVIGSLSLILSSFESISTDAIRYTGKTFSIKKVNHLTRCQTLQTGSTLGQTLSCELDRPASCEHDNQIEEGKWQCCVKIWNRPGVILWTYKTRTMQTKTTFPWNVKVYITP